VDGAYGGAGLFAPSVRALFAGLEQADSFVVDPPKWLSAPYDCAALLYANPALARPVHRQEAIEAALTLARQAAGEIGTRGYLELVAEPELSVVPVELIRQILDRMA
jgi:glutamate/tyrosine decarboxylase-like PLP-dependent enzyme